MTPWEALTRWVRSTYTLARDEPGEISLEMPVGDDRSQLVVIKLTTLGDGFQFAEISTGVGLRHEVDPVKCLERNAKMTGGAIAFTGDMAIFRQVERLPVADVSDFALSLSIVAGTGDRLERELVGGDRF